MGVRSSGWYQSLIANELVRALPRPIRGILIALCAVCYYPIILFFYASGLWLPIAIWGQYHPKSWYETFGPDWELVDYGPDGRPHRIEPDVKPRWTWFESVLAFVYGPMLLFVFCGWLYTRFHPH